MRINVQLAAALIAAVAIGAGVTPASAGGRHTIEVRSGPGETFRVIDRLHVGDAVDLRRCMGDWCYVWKWDCDGWVYVDDLPALRKSSPDIFKAPWIEPFIR
jgi:uncharacterized protein YraI